MAEEYTIIMFPEFEKLLKEVERLRTEFSMLLLERDELQYVVCKNIETAYMLSLGSLEYKAFEIECEMWRLHRKIELIQAKINRQEKVDLKAIDETLDDEFEEYQRKLDEQINKMNAALEHSQCEKMTEEQTKEFKKLYRTIVKALHPDLNPDASPAQIQLFQNAVKAYENGDIASLKIISEMVSEPKLPEKGSDGMSVLIEEISRLEKLIELINERITGIKNEYPYTLKTIVESTEKTEERRKELQSRIDEMTDVVEFYKRKINGMVKR